MERKDTYYVPSMQQTVDAGEFAGERDIEIQALKKLSGKNNNAFMMGMRNLDEPVSIGAFDGYVERKAKEQGLPMKSSAIEAAKGFGEGVVKAPARWAGYAATNTLPLIAKTATSLYALSGAAGDAESADKWVREANKGIEAWTKEVQRITGIEDASTFENVVGNALGSVWGSVAIGGIFGGEAVAPMFGASAMQDTYVRQREAGTGMGESLVRGAIHGTGEAALERLQFNRIFGSLAKKSKPIAIVKDLLEYAVQEGLQQANELGANWNIDNRSLIEKLQEIGVSMVGGAVASLGGSVGGNILNRNTVNEVGDLMKKTGHSDEEIASVKNELNKIVDTDELQQAANQVAKDELTNVALTYKEQAQAASDALVVGLEDTIKRNELVDMGGALSGDKTEGMPPLYQLGDIQIDTAKNPNIRMVLYQAEQAGQPMQTLGQVLDWTKGKLNLEQARKMNTGINAVYNNAYQQLKAIGQDETLADANARVRSAMAYTLAKNYDMTPEQADSMLGGIMSQRASEFEGQPAQTQYQDVAQRINEIDAEEQAKGVPEYTAPTININGVERQTTNSDGNPIAKSEKSLRYFYDWFGDSKVVDEQGRPLVVYHGGGANIEVFDYSRIGEQGRSEGAGFEFTQNKDIAEGYAQRHGGGFYAVYLTIRNPIRDIEQKTLTEEQKLSFLEKVNEKVNADEEYVSEMGEDSVFSDYMGIYGALDAIENDTDLDVVNELINTTHRNKEILEAFVETTGYDGVILTEGSEWNENGLYVAFNNNQIKSTSNRGTFSSSENIYYQRIQFGGRVINAFNDITTKDGTPIKYTEYENEHNTGVNREAMLDRNNIKIVRMSPQQFLDLAPSKMGNRDVTELENAIKSGKEIAMPFLEVEILDKHKKILKIFGHEGRHRSLAMSNLGVTDGYVILNGRDFYRHPDLFKEGLTGWKILGQTETDKSKAVPLSEDARLQYLNKQQYQDETNPRGAYYNNTVYLFENANESTFVHEMAHSYMDVLERLAQNGNTKAESDLNVIRNWLGKKQDESFTQADWERFARGFEMYMREGKSPNQYLGGEKGVFARFRDWLMHIYAGIKTLRVKNEKGAEEPVRINNQIRRFYDEMLGGTSIDEVFDTAEKNQQSLEVLDNKLKQLAEAQQKLAEEKARLVREMANNVKPDTTWANVKDWGKNVWESAKELPSNVLQSSYERLAKIDSRLGLLVQRAEQAQGLRLKKWADEVQPFYEAFNKLSNDDKARVQYFLLNQQWGDVEDILGKEGTEAVHGMLEEIYNELQDSGVEVGYRDNYFPRAVLDYDGLLQEMGLTYPSLRKEMEEAIGKDATPQEQAEWLDKHIMGFKGTVSTSGNRNTKERKLDLITDRMAKYYKPSMETLVDYMNGMAKLLSMREAFGKDIEYKDSTAEDSIGKIINRLFGDNKFTKKEIDEVRDVLSALYLPSGMGNKFLQAMRQYGYATKLSYSTTVRQFADIGMMMKVNGVLNTLDALFHPDKRITLENLGIDPLGEEFNTSKTDIGGRLANISTKWKGINWADAIMKNAFMRGNYKDLQKLAKTPEKFHKKYDSMFGDEVDTLIKDLNADKITEPVKVLLFHEISKIQPISRSAMPTAYLQNPNGRVFYMFKTFSLHRAEYMVSELADDFRRGDYKKAGKDIMADVAVIGWEGLVELLITFLKYGWQALAAEAVLETFAGSGLGVLGLNKHQALQLTRGQIGDFFQQMVGVGTPLDDIGYLIRHYDDDDKLLRAFLPDMIIEPLVAGPKELK